MSKVGRKTKYKGEFCNKLIEFFDVEPYVDVKIPHYEKTGKKDKKGKRVVVWYDIKRMPNKLPTLRDFAKSIKVHISNVYEWLNEKSSAFQPEFRDAYICAKEIRKWFLIQNGLQGFYPPLSYKFTAINITDMRDVSEQINKGSVEMSFSPELLELAKQMAEQFAKEVK